MPVELIEFRGENAIEPTPGPLKVVVEGPGIRSWIRKAVRSKGVSAGLRAALERKVKSGLNVRFTMARMKAMKPEYVAPLVAWLCTDAAAHVNGALPGGRVEDWPLF